MANFSRSQVGNAHLVPHDVNVGNKQMDREADHWRQ